ncbi:MAG: serine/threonine protein kinase, partial [Myxococcaceae bacterium]|nr:serine/threonine protein kinase [Myxococcaceae bacterium]
DARFAREALLLSRAHSPHLPRLHDTGTWECCGRHYPYIVMQWVEGVPLYHWARATGRLLTSRQALRLLAQLARALEALHQHGLHRDVKGDNVLVGLDGHAVLLDVGACWLPEGRPLTVDSLPPGTPRYRSPEALAFRERFYGKTKERYQARPQDDVYALGVTAYRLITGTYPPEPGGSGRFLKPNALATVAPVLEELVLRMLAPEWEARGTAGELAQALETAAAGAHPSLDEPVLPSRSVLPTELTRFRGHWAWRARMLARAVLTLTGVATAILALLVAAPLLQQLQEEGGAHGVTLPPVAPGWHVPHVETPDAGVGETTLASAQDLPRTGMPTYALALSMPKGPFPGQKKPPCDPRSEVAALGACWLVLRVDPPCGVSGFEYEGKCIHPNVPMPRQPTSEQP